MVEESETLIMNFLLRCAFVVVERLDCFLYSFAFLCYKFVKVCKCWVDFDGLLCVCSSCFISTISSLMMLLKIKVLLN